MPLEPRGMPPGLCAPQAAHAVIPPREERRPVGAEGDTADPRGGIPGCTLVPADARGGLAVMERDQALEAQVIPHLPIEKGIMKATNKRYSCWPYAQRGEAYR